MKTYHVTEWANELRVHYYTVEAKSAKEAAQMFRDGQAKLEGSKTKELYSSDWSIENDDDDWNAETKQ